MEAFQTIGAALAIGAFILSLITLVTIKPLRIPRPETICPDCHFSMAYHHHPVCLYTKCECGGGDVHTVSLNPSH